ncbi:MAG: DMT family transporter [bacterium]|nr:DMT family transporter [bacterium]
METWIVAALVAYFFAGSAKIIDKVILAGPIKQPIMYTFYGGLLSGLVLLFLPFLSFDVEPRIILVGLISGIFFLGHLYFLYLGLRHYDSSRVVPLFVSIAPFFTLILALYTLGEDIGRFGLQAVFFLILGGFFLVWERQHQNVFYHSLVWIVLAAATLLSISLVLLKYVFLNAGFIDGLFWSRMGSFLGALLIFLIPSCRHTIRSSNLPSAHGSALLLVNKAIGAIGAFLVSFALSRGVVSVVHALAAFEYFFVFIISIFLAFFAPRVLKEDFSVHALSVKVLGALSMSFALYLLFLS